MRQALVAVHTALTVPVQWSGRSIRWICQCAETWCRYDHVLEPGLEIAEQYGDWDRSALAAGTPEIITIAKSLLLD